jgi:hypothetical protein
VTHPHDLDVVQTPFDARREHELVVEEAAEESREAVAGTPEREAVAVLVPTYGSEANGVVRFVERDGRIDILASIDDDLPDGVYRAAVHQYGDCSAPDASSAGPRLEPDFDAASLAGDELVGRAVVLHAPTGEPLACGIIGRVDPRALRAER